jgi:hypothetical protein
MPVTNTVPDGLTKQAMRAPDPSHSRMTKSGADAMNGCSVARAGEACCPAAAWQLPIRYHAYMNSVRACVTERPGLRAPAC